MRPGILLAMSTTVTDLTDTDLRMLTFERTRWKYAGSKEAAIWAGFGLSATKYYQALNRLIDHPAALATDPMLVRRLRRLRGARARQRSAARLAFEV